MPILIDYINDSPDVLKSKFSSIQRRFFDHFSLKLTTETNKYVYINNYLNEYTTKIFGNNTVICGLKCTLIELNTTDKYAIFEFEKGYAVSDSVLIEFTDNFQIKQSLTKLSTDETEWNIAFIKFKNVISYPTNVAEIIIQTKSLIEASFDKKLLNGVITAFKLNNEGISNQIPYYGDLTNVPPEAINDEIELFGITIKIPPYIAPNSSSITNTFQQISNSIKESVNKLIESSAAILIKKPQIIQPTNGQIDFSGKILSSPFQAKTNSFKGPHTASDWEIALDSNFNHVVESSYSDSTHLTSYTPTTLDPKTTYYVRVRYISDYHVSEWSDPVSFTTPNAYIETPSISVNTPPGSLYPEFELSQFHAVGYNDNWQSTDWEIATDSNFQNKVLQYTETNQSKYNKLKIVSDLLEPDSTCYVRARYNGDQGHSSNWSTPLEYHTQKYVLDNPHIADEYVENTDVTKTITHDGGKTFDSTKYKLIVTVDLGTVDINEFTFTWHIPDVDQDTTANIEIKVVDKNDDTKVVSTVFTKQVNVTNIPLVADNAAIVTDFSDYQYNDGWNI